jgi:hypothetical protein
MTTLPPFRLSVARPTTLTPGPSALPQELSLDLRAHRNGSEFADEGAESPATSTKKGSFRYDQASGDYPMEWPSLADFEAWRGSEERAHTIELIGAKFTSGGPLWTQKRVYVCARQRSGGQKHYEKVHPDWQRKIDTKKTGCRCRVIIKLYPHSPIILGHYTKEHDHEIGAANIKFTQLSRGVREQIKLMLAQKMDVREIVRK